MRVAIFSITSVTRWLLVVVGCAVWETAQPMSAAEEAKADTARALAADTIIYPKGEPGSAAAPAQRSSTSSRSWLLLGTLLLASGGTWMIVKRRGSAPFGSARGVRKILIEETRSLGNRQYLVVAGYEGRKFLLGVTPGQIQMLTSLDEPQKGEVNS